MAYIVRVELFKNDDGKEADYDELHKLLAAKAFYRTIRDDDGGWWWLPPATYYKRTDASVDEVFDRALSIVRAFWLHSSVLVVETSEIHWEGLRSASRNDRNQEKAGRGQSLRRLNIESRTDSL